MHEEYDELHDGDAGCDQTSEQLRRQLQKRWHIMGRDLSSIEEIVAMLEKYKTYFEKKGGDELKRYWGRLLEAQRVYGSFKQRYVVEEGDGGE
eukprot:510118-Rhodomonas_salina.1